MPDQELFMPEQKLLMPEQKLPMPEEELLMPDGKLGMPLGLTSPPTPLPPRADTAGEGGDTVDGVGWLQANFKWRHMLRPEVSGLNLHHWGCLSGSEIVLCLASWKFLN